jgi:hypothetical protein
VLKADADRVTAAEGAWHDTLRDIEASATFKDVSIKLSQLLSTQRSAAAAHRVLVKAGLTYDSVGQYRRNGYRLLALHAAEALRLFGVSDPALEAKIEQADILREEMHKVPPGIPTGINGLEM